MKKSDKILLGGFAAVLLILTAIHISLFANYKSGKTTLYNAGDDLPSDAMQLIPNMLFVSMYDVSDVTVRFGDGTKIEKMENSKLTWVQKRDTLVITGPGGHAVSNDLQAIQLPYNVRLSLFNSVIYFDGSRKTAPSQPEIQLHRSHAIFSGTDVPLAFDSMRLAASDSSSAAFRGNTQVGKLQVQLSKSTLEYLEGSPGTLSIASDTASLLLLKAKHFSGSNIQLLPKE